MQSSSPSKIRLDQALVALGLADTRTQAQGYILAGLVQVNGQRQDKAGQAVQPATDIITLAADDRCPYVSRGGLKLAHAIQRFQLNIEQRVVVDIGASTGGFTDCALQAGAKQVYAVDVGYGQLDYRLRQDERVVVMERTNARHLQASQFEPPPALLVCDVSFISLKKILPACQGLLQPDLAGSPWMMALLKPQFECLDYFSPQQAKRFDGVIRDPADRLLVVQGVLQDLTALLPSWHLTGLARSPIVGAKGNVELLTLWQTDQPALDWQESLLGLMADPERTTSTG